MSWKSDKLWLMITIFSRFQQCFSLNITDIYNIISYVSWEETSSNFELEGIIMRIGVPKERITNEARIAATPLTVKQLIKLGFSVVVEREAGHLASFEDAAFKQAGAEIVEQQSVWDADIIFKVNAPLETEIALIKEGAILVSFIWPA